MSLVGILAHGSFHEGPPKSLHYVGCVYGEHCCIDVYPRAQSCFRPLQVRLDELFPKGIQGHCRPICFETLGAHNVCEHAAMGRLVAFKGYKKASIGLEVNVERLIHSLIDDNLSTIINLPRLEA